MCSIPSSATLLKRYCPKGIVDISVMVSVSSRRRIRNKKLQAAPNVVKYTELEGENECLGVKKIRVSGDSTSLISDVVIFDDGLVSWLTLTRDLSYALRRRRSAPRPQ